jgi:O-antigen ligase
MLTKLHNDPKFIRWRTHLIFGTLILMMGSLFISRAMLSMSMIALLVFSSFHPNIKSHLKKFFSTPLLWGMSLLFLIPLLTVFWSEDQESWMKVVVVKLPLFILPLAFAGGWQLSAKQWQSLAGVFLMIVFAGTVWSVSQYLINSTAIHEAYLKAKTIPVPLEGDHVRFSWLVCVGLIVALLLLTKANWLKIILLLLAAWFIVYLHILAARTGLFACYLFIIAFAFYKLFSTERKKLSLVIIVAGLLLPVVAWFYFPTFQNRFKYLRYDYDFVKNSSYLPGATDGNRLFSIKAGWHILKENPLGVGAGDLRTVTNRWYDKEVSGMLEMDKIYPSNEWLIYGGFAGWPGILLFTFVMAIPLVMKGIKHRFYWLCFHGIAIFSFLVDTGLEVQFGIFIYIFITCCWWKWQQMHKE